MLETVIEFEITEITLKNLAHLVGNSRTTVEEVAAFIERIREQIDDPVLDLTLFKRTREALKVVKGDSRFAIEVDSGEWIEVWAMDDDHAQIIAEAMGHTVYCIQKGEDDV